jgi:hypothetical protein
MRATAPLALLALLTSCKITAPAAAEQAPDPAAQTPTPTPTPAGNPTPTPTPTPTAAVAGTSPVIAVDLSGATAIATTDFNVNTAVHATSYMPAAEAGVGAFRFNCGAGQLSYDDPIVYPGQPGKSHLHQFYGNLTIDANSTYATGRGAGDSTCNSSGLQDGTGNAANRSGYWMPAMLTGTGYLAEPDFVNVYYKRIPASDPRCADPSNTAVQAIGICVAIPNAIRFIAGYDMVTNTPPTGHVKFKCVAGNNVIGTYTTLAALAAAGCAAGNKLEAEISFPPCWDGKNLDSANHRDHTAYWSYGSWGYLRCPADHPYLMPVFTLAVFYTIQAIDDLAKWHFSSDEMHPELPAGSTFHADYFEGWDPGIKAEWTANCIDKQLSCFNGNLGDGRQLTHAGEPIYDGVPRWTNPHARVPVPPRPAG